jgi:chemotaxis protein MotB
MLIRRHTQIESGQNLDRWLLTYADMITLLTAFFLMLYSMSVMSRGKFTQLASSVRNGFGGALDGGPSILSGGGAHTVANGPQRTIQGVSYEDAMRNLARFVEQSKLSDKVNVRSDERGVVISLVSDNMLFARGQSALRPQSRPILERVGNVLKSLPNAVQIEGHTCDLPIRTTQFPSNWELSTARAGAVLRIMTEQQGLDSRRFTAAGYADTRPLRPNASEADRTRNRRVDIVILKSESQRETDVLRRAELRRILVREKTRAGVAAQLPAEQ